MKPILLILFLFLSAFNAEPTFTEYTVDKGSNNFKPDQFKIVCDKKFTLVYYVKFTDDSKYEIKNQDGTYHEDQWDWLKGGGISNNLLSNMKDAALWAFRWNAVLKKFELTGYFHVNGKTFYSENTFQNRMVRVDTNEILKITVEKNNVWSVKIYNSSDVLLQSYSILSSGTPCLSRYIGAWFGGTSPAPKVCKIYITKPIKK